MKPAEMQLRILDILKEDYELDVLITVDMINTIIDDHKII